MVVVLLTLHLQWQRFFPNVTNLAITTQPTKTTYIEGQSFDPTGMVVTATYSDGTSGVVANYTYAPTGALTPSDTAVVVSYGGKTASVSVTVNAINLVVAAAQDSDGSLFGKDASDLQENIVVGDDAITGTLNYIADYSSAFSGSDASGHYLALKFTAIAGATLVVEIVNGFSGPVTLDPDGLWVGRIANTNQSVKVVATIDGVSQTKTFALTDIVLAE